MKIRGKAVGVHEEPIIIPRPDGDVEIIAKAVEDAEKFEKMCPPPQPKAKKLPNGDIIRDFEDKRYQKDLEAWAEKKTAWMVIKSITAGTPDLTWEEVDLSNHTTWMKYKDEMRESGFSENEINRITNAMLRANGLSEAAFAEARQRFLLRRQVAAAESSESTSPTVEASNTSSGELASDGESNPGPKSGTEYREPPKTT